MIFANAQKATERHHRIRDLPADLVDHQSLDPADSAVISTVDSGAFDPVAGDQRVSLALRRVFVRYHVAFSSQRGFLYRTAEQRELDRADGADFEWPIDAFMRETTRVARDARSHTSRVIDIEIVGR